MKKTTKKRATKKTAKKTTPKRATKLLAWHFLPESMRLAHGDGREVVVGETLKHVAGGELRCGNGLHASERLIDAMGYANGLPVLTRVEVGGEILKLDDKLVATERKVLWALDAATSDAMLRLFAVWCARTALALTGSTDPRSVAACDVAERFACGDATREELAAAWAAAWDAARAAQNARLEQMAEAARSGGIEAVRALAQVELTPKAAPAAEAS